MAFWLWKRYFWGPCAWYNTYMCAQAPAAKSRYVVGIDEAGRGPLAGPVAVGAVLVSEARSGQFSEFFKGVKDSKQLSRQKREEWFLKMREARTTGMIDFQVSLIGSHTIDKHGITTAIAKGIKSTLRRFYVPAVCCSVLLDGGLSAPRTYRRQKTIIRGDESEMIIALASIAAKVTRDRLMLTLSRKYPAYGFEEHKGYGTILHYKSLRKFGPSSIHRMSFLGSL